MLLDVGVAMTVEEYMSLVYTTLSGRRVPAKC